MIDVSIIVCTRNRAHALPFCLNSISAAVRNASAVAVELILIDNGSTDETSALATEWALTAGFPIKVLREGRPGLSAARNAGVQAATGRILVFTDDDCRMDPNYLVDLQKHDSRDSGPTIRGGRVDPGDPADLPFTIKDETRMARLSDGVFPGGFILGCNMTMSRQVFDRIGLFDEHFGAGALFRSSEETELLLRAHLARIPIEYVPDMSVAHFHGRRDLKSIKSLNFGYHYGTGAVHAKHLAHSKFVRNVYWMLKNAGHELFGGEKFCPALNLSYRSVVGANICGLFSYLAWRARTRLNVLQGSYGSDNRRAGNAP